MPDSTPLISTQEIAAPKRSKRLGGYLVEAGLLTPAQVDVALNDQKLTGMRFGEILAARGWVKQQTIEYLMQKVILPEQTQKSESAIAEDGAQMIHSKQIAGSAGFPNSKKPAPAKQALPISKPLPGVPSSNDDVHWVG